jgi:hypothetical protein
LSLRKDFHGKKRLGVQALIIEIHGIWGAAEAKKEAIRLRAGAAPAWRW